LYYGYRYYNPQPSHRNLKKMCWLDRFALPHGRGEKENNQTNTLSI
jgi:hypothetical protein